MGGGCRQTRVSHCCVWVSHPRPPQSFQRQEAEPTRARHFSVPGKVGGVIALMQPPPPVCSRPFMLTIGGGDRPEKQTLSRTLLFRFRAKDGAVGATSQLACPFLLCPGSGQSETEAVHILHVFRNNAETAVIGHI